MSDTTTNPYALRSVRMRAEVDIDGVTHRLPIRQAQLQFELNSVPQARLLVATGRRTGDWAYSPIHDLDESFLSAKRPCRVYLTLSEVTANLPAGSLGRPLGGERLVFDGDVVAAGLTRGEASAGYELVVEHWLGRLRSASVLSKQAYPADGSHFAFGAILGLISGSGGDAQPGRAFGPEGRAIELGARVQQDRLLWDSGFLPWLRDVSSQDLFLIDSLPQLSRDGPNARAIAALDRMRGGSRPLKLRVDASDEAAVTAIVRGLLDVARPELLTGQSVWDLLVGRFAPNHLFWIVPRVSTAEAAAVTPGYRGAWRQLYASWTTEFRWTSQISSRLKGVVVRGWTRSNSNFSLVGGVLPGVVGAYVPDEGANGIVRVLDGPDWMAEASLPARKPDQTLGADGRPLPFAAAPGVPAPPAAEPAPRQALADRFARYLYHQLALQGRQAVVAGPLRLDIAPGSSVDVIGTGNGPDADPGGQSVSGTVHGVTLMISAEPAWAQTQLHLNFVRTAAENRADEASTLEHPLYADPFVGAELL